MNKRIKKKHRRCRGSYGYLVQLKARRRRETDPIERIRLSKVIDMVRKEDKVWTNILKRNKAVNIDIRRRYGAKFSFDNSVSLMYPTRFKPNRSSELDSLFMPPFGQSGSEILSGLSIRVDKSRPEERTRLTFRMDPSMWTEEETPEHE